ncbi:MAG TPA: hypothetical protein VMV81_07435 [Phycisphaerae bacterium]|nr:hypothetical protein [Phycisphaerae bacterium]
MNRVFRMNVIVTALLAGSFAALTGCTGGGSSIVPFAGTVPDAAKSLDGTYLVTLSQADAAQLGGSELTIVISGGLFTKLGMRDLTPTNVTSDGTNFVWTSGASIQYSGAPVPLDTIVTLTMVLQADNSLVGTMELSSYGVTSQPINATLTKQ